MNSLIRYPGGKSKLCQQIIDKLSSYITPNTIYYEPFFGGGGIGLKLLKNPPLKSPLGMRYIFYPTISSIWINDKDIGISCLWTSVIKYAEKLKRKIIDFKPSVFDFYAFKRELLRLDRKPILEDDIVDIGFKKLAIHQISYSGLGTKSGGPLGGINQQSKYLIDCRWSPKYLCKKIDNFHTLFSNINIEQQYCTNEDFGVLLNNANTNCLVYLDPPYYVKGNELYQCGFNENDHVRLSNMLRIANYKWLLSYDDCPEIRKLYWWANTESLSVNYTINTSNNKNELLITNAK
jgi:DNA adenine methylase